MLSQNRTSLSTNGSLSSVPSAVSFKRSFKLRNHLIPCDAYSPYEIINARIRAQDKTATNPACSTLNHGDGLCDSSRNTGEAMLDRVNQANHSHISPSRLLRRPARCLPKRFPGVTAAMQRE